MTYTRFLAWVALFGALAASVLCGLVYAKLTQADHQRDLDRLAARNQTCLLNERDHLEDVKLLRRTYARIPQAVRFYLETSPPHLRPFLLNAIRTDLERLEKEARTDQAPAFCDEPGVEAEREGADPVGLPEPDPVIPTRPPAVDRALKP